MVYYVKGLYYYRERFQCQRVVGGGGRVMGAREKTPERKRIVKIWKPIQGSDLRSGGGLGRVLKG